MALNIFNLSADAPDANPSLPEDLCLNEMESISEVVAEELLGFENAFQESDEPDQPDGQSLDLKKISLFFIRSETKSLAIQEPVKNMRGPESVSPCCSYRYTEVLIPPPETSLF